MVRRDAEARKDHCGNRDDHDDDDDGDRDDQRLGLAKCSILCCWWGQPMNSFVGFVCWCENFDFGFEWDL